MLGWVGGLRTTSSTTSRGDFWALRASTPTLRQWRNAASRGRRRSAASETGISPAPPCRAMAHPIILSLSLSLSGRLSTLKNGESERAEWNWFAKPVLEVCICREKERMGGQGVLL